MLASRLAVFVGLTLGAFAMSGVRAGAETGPSGKTVSPKAGHPEDVYGKVLPIVRDLGIGPTKGRPGRGLWIGRFE